MIVFYARCSTANQNIQRQLETAKEVNAEKILEVENRMEYAIDGNTKIYAVPLCFEGKGEPSNGDYHSRQ